MAQFGSFEYERCLRQNKRVRKGTVVEKFCRSKAKNFSGTARVSCVREHIALRAGEILLTVKPLYNSRFIGETVFWSCPKKQQRPHKIPQTRIFREIWIIKKLNIEAWLSLVERCVREHIALRAGEIRLTVKPLYNSRFIGEAVFRSSPKKRQRPHKIPQTRIFRES